MANRVVEVLYKLRDLFTSPARKIRDGYKDIERSSDRAAKKIADNNDKTSGSFGKFVAGIRKARLAFGAFAGVATAGAVFQGLKSLANNIDRIGKLAGQLNLEPSTLSAYGFVAERSGIQVQTMEKSIAELIKRSGEAKQGIGEASAAFKALGIDVERFVELDLDGKMELLADAFSLVEDEETKAALAARLFGEAGGEMLRALNGGSAALAELVQKGKEFRYVSKEMIEAAAEFNDTLTDTKASIDGVVLKLGNPALQAFNHFVGSVGLSANELKNLQYEFAQAQENLRRAELSGIEPLIDRYGVEVYKLTARLDDYFQSSMKAKGAEEDRKQTLQEAANDNANYQASVEALTKSFEDQVKVRQQALKSQTAELESARREQLQIEEEFARLEKDVTATDKDTVTGLDVQIKALEARRLLAEGNAEGAVQAAKDGGDLLRALKDQGDEAGYVLSFLAKQLGEVANQAAAEKTQAEFIDVEQAQSGVDLVTGKLEAFSQNAKNLGATAGKSFVEAFTAELNALQVTVPGPNVASPGSGDVREYLQRELVKRGGK